MDDFCALAQSQHKGKLQHVSRSLLHSIHEVFPPPKMSGLGGEDSVLLKKLRAVEGVWETRKELLGWMFDGHTRCIKLPVGKVATIRKLINQMVAARSVQRRDYKKLLRKVRHAAMGVPGSQGIFTPLNMTLRSKPDGYAYRHMSKRC